MSLNVNDFVKISFVIMSLPYLVVTIFLLLVCFRKLANNLGLGLKSECDIEESPKPLPKIEYSPKSSLSSVVPPNPISGGNREQFINMAASGIDFFDTPGICQQTRFDSRVVTFDTGNKMYTKDRRQPLSAAQYLEFYNTPYYF